MLKKNKKAMISRIFIFFAVFYAIMATLTIILSTSMPEKLDPNCADQNALSTKTYETPGWLDMVASAWNMVLNIFTLGLATKCGVPAFLLWVIGLFNVGIIGAVGGIALGFFLRGTS